MKQMQGFKAQFMRITKKAKKEKYSKPQDHMSDTETTRSQRIAMGSQHTANPNTIAMDIFNTFLSLCWRCCPALADCSPGIFCDLSFT